jgi:hypothetical protein
LKQAEQFIALRGHSDQIKAENLVPVPRGDAIESISVDSLDYLPFHRGESSADRVLGSQDCGPVFTSRFENHCAFHI